MPDVFTKAKRSEVMSRIRGRGLELKLAPADVVRHFPVWAAQDPPVGRRP